MKFSVACMKRKLNFVTWWRYFSGQSIKIAFSTTKMAPPGGDIKFVFHRSKSKFPTLSHEKNFFWISLSKQKVAKFMS